MDFSQLGALASRLGSILRRPLYLISVRARIVALALIPVLGFAIIGFAYLAGEREVEAAFESVLLAAMSWTVAQVLAGCAEYCQAMYPTFVELDRPPVDERDATPDGACS